jgi:aminopeptidase YwaD
VKSSFVLAATLLLTSIPVQADLRDLIAEETLKQIAEETSGAAAKRNLDTVTLQHRMRSGSQFDVASQHIYDTLKGYGLDEVGFLYYAADGDTMFGTQKSRPLWDVRSAELWELEEVNGETRRVRRLGDWNSVPLSLAQDSLSGDATTTLVDIGDGTSDADYSGKDVRGKLVLTESQPEAVVDLAVGKYGAAGIISYAPNQKSAWWKEDDRLVRWGHIGSFAKTKSFGFMISLGEARKLQQRLEAGEEILFHANVDASHEKGQYRFVTAAIHGSDKPEEVIHYTCHLDHPRPGANDNASGCMAILETARTLNALVRNGVLPRPSRTLRFLWPAEIEGSIIYLTHHDVPSKFKANIHMDMVGGGPVTKSVFRISGGPMSVPSFISDLGHEVGRFVNDETERFASGDDVEFPLYSKEGGKEPLLAIMEGLDMGSDHDVFFEGTWRIPGLYLHDWPDRYIHTNFDLAANIDPTKLKRSAFIGAVTGWFLANMSSDDVPDVLAMLNRNTLARTATLMEQTRGMNRGDAAAATNVFFEHERRKIDSISRFVEFPEADIAKEWVNDIQGLIPVDVSDEPRIETVYVRNAELQGPMHGFDYSWIVENLGEEAFEKLELPRYEGVRGSGDLYTYEALNFVDGIRTVSDIRDWLTAELGPVPVEHVQEYLQALESVGVVRSKNKKQGG